MEHERLEQNIRAVLSEWDGVALPPFHVDELVRDLMEACSEVLEENAELRVRLEIARRYAKEGRRGRLRYRTMRRALEEVVEGRGPYSRDRLTHATNVIEAMQETARAALNPEPSP